MSSTTLLIRGPGRPRKIPPNTNPHICYYCKGTKERSPVGKKEELINCFDCRRSVHPYCSELSKRAARVARTYRWQCNECKSCQHCKKKNDEDQLIFCSNCDRGCHTYCAVPALEEAPEDDWFCEVCNSQTGSGSSRPKSKSRVGGTSQSPTPRKRPQHHTADSSSSEYEEDEEEEEEEKEEQEEEEEPEEEDDDDDDDAEEESSDPEPAPPKSSHHHNHHHRHHHHHHNHSHNNHKSKKESATNGSNHKAKRRHRVASSDNHAVEDEYRYNLDENEGTVPTASTSSGANRHKKRAHQHHLSESVSASATMSSSTKQPPLKLKLTVKPNKGKKRADNRGDDSMAVDQDQRVPSEDDHVEPEDDEDMLGFFGGKLTKEEADTSRSTPGMRDKERFERAKAAGEAKANPRHAAAGGTLSTHSHHHSNHHSYDAHDAAHADAASDAPKIKMIRFGGYDIDTWYVAPYPEEYSQHPVLFICEFCLKYMKSAYVAGRHKIKCPMKHPPGDEIYRDGIISIFEVDGRKNKIYCQNLCLLAKMFLDHKTLYYDVEPFLFYVMTEVNDTGCHFVGYFSKEKRSPMNYNVSCILTLPIHQRKGYGNLLIDFSYLLSKKEGKTGSPEKPLSDLGLLSYRNYWKNVVFEELRTQKDPVSIEEISNRTSMTPDDIISTLQTNNMLFRDEETSQHVILINRPVIQTHHERMEAKGYPKIKPDNLTWSPFVLTRSMMRTVSAGGTAAAAAANGDGGREVKEEEMDDEDDVKIEGAGRMEKKEEKAKMKGNGEMLKKLRSRK